MPSNLRLQLDLESTASYYPRPTSPSSSPKSKMSLTQTYRVASTARTKLGMEASRSDHNLRLLVGHANLLDSLMVDLQTAEREQEAWFNDTIRNNRHSEAPKHIQWVDTVAEEQEVYDEDSSESDSDSDTEDIDDVPAFVPARTISRSVSPPPSIVVSAVELDEMGEDEVEDSDSDSDELALERVPSHTPELVHEDDSEDDSMPPSPPTLAISFDTKTHDFASVPLFPMDEKMDSMVNSAPMISAY